MRTNAHYYALIRTNSRCVMTTGVAMRSHVKKGIHVAAPAVPAPPAPKGEGPHLSCGVDCGMDKGSPFYGMDDSFLV